MLSLRAFFAVLLISFNVAAAEFYEYNQSVRALAMGGVRIFEDQDSSVIYWNPGGLGLLKGMSWKIADFSTGISGMQTMQTLGSLGAISGPSSFAQFYGKSVWVGSTASMAFALPNFGFGVYGSGLGTFTMTNPAFPNLNVTYFNDYGYVFGGAVPLGPTGAFGVNLKRITRSGQPKNYGPDAFATLNSNTIMSDLANEGTGYGIDFGAMYEFPAAFKPTISLSWQDFGSTVFVVTRGVTPPSISENLVFNFNFHGEVPGLGIAGGLEYRHITQWGESLGKKLHMGLELSLAFFDLRAGFYQGYKTYGIGTDAWIFEIDMAQYSVEKGAYPGQTQDERLQFSISTEFSFDPDFNITDMGGRKRRLKQRR